MRSEAPALALQGRTSQALEDDEGSFHERTRHLILPPSDAEIGTTDNVGDVIEEKHARIVDGYRRRRGARRDPPTV
jgi:hypothetical protein